MVVLWWTPVGSRRRAPGGPLVVPWWSPGGLLVGVSRGLLVGSWWAPGGPPVADKNRCSRMRTPDSEINGLARASFAHKYGSRAAIQVVPRFSLVVPRGVGRIAGTCHVRLASARDPHPRKMCEIKGLAQVGGTGGIARAPARGSASRIFQVPTFYQWVTSSVRKVAPVEERSSQDGLSVILIVYL